MSRKTAMLLRRVFRHRNLENFAALAVPTGNYNKYEDSNQTQGKYGKVIAAAFLSSVLIGSTVADQVETNNKVNRSKQHKGKADIATVEAGPNAPIEAGHRRPDLPTYRAEEVSKHDTKSSFWVTYQHGVYDVTAFLPSHPGGEQILNAAGLSVEPFWNVYGMHKTQEVFALLETYRIGNLHEDDVADHSDEKMWAREPRRDPSLVVRAARPFNAETPARRLVEHFDTPNELFYVRQHMPVPELDARAHRVRVVVRAGAGASAASEREFTLEQLEQFPRATVRAALMCAGNRRSEMDKVKPVKGLSWQSGAVGSAVWAGVALRDVLVACGVDERGEHGERARHVVFTGADVDATGENFSTSIPLHMALDPAQRVLLATHMNGHPLPPDHGHPVRVIVPGAPAVRSVKWLESITVSEEESSSHWHQKDYRSFNASTTWETADFSTAPPLYSLPVTAATCDPLHGDTVRVRDGCIELAGYAYSGGGAKILRVDVSIDNGRSWTQAQRLQCDDAPPRQHYAWALWTANVPVQKHLTEVEVWVKAMDSNFNTQPERFDDIWNIRGLLSNAYHRITVKLQH